MTFREERGASLVEFALILPVFMMLVLGMFSGGISYNRDISITNAVREGSRYGATLPVNGDLTDWLRTVATVVRDNATGDLDNAINDRRICVAYVFPVGTAVNDRTTRLVVGPGQDPSSATPEPNERCPLASGATYDDGITNNAQRRVNVVASRSSTLEVLFFSHDLTLQAQSVTRFEANRN